MPEELVPRLATARSGNHEARLRPVEEAARSDEQRAVIEPLGDLGDLHLLGTLLHHPRLLDGYLGFGGRLLLEGVLSARTRELVILRVAWRCRCAYEWGQHVQLGLDAGLTNEEIDRVRRGRDDRSWSDDDRMLLTLVDELLDSHDAGDARWAWLEERFDAAARVELLVQVGHYAMLAGLLNACRVQVEQPLPPLGRSTTSG